MNAPLTDAEGAEVVVKITLSTIYSTLLDLKQTISPVPEKLTDHEARIRMLERRIWTAAGTTAVATGVVVATVAKAISEGN